MDRIIACETYAGFVIGFMDLSLKVWVKMEVSTAGGCIWNQRDTDGQLYVWVSRPNYDSLIIEQHSICSVRMESDGCILSLYYSEERCVNIAEKDTHCMRV